MPFTFEIKTERNRTFASVTGYDGPVRTLFVPAETADHIPVEEIAGRAFASRADLEELILPESIRCIRSFAFHNCAHLHYVKLSDSVVDYYDGALRQCPELQDIELTLHNPGRFRLLKELVGDSDAMLPLTIHFPVDPEHPRADEHFFLPDSAVVSSGTGQDLTLPGAASASQGIASSLTTFASTSAGITASGARSADPEATPLVQSRADGRYYATAALTFPSYADNYQEDTMARAIHEHIEGAGYATRQLVTRTGIDFQGYDRQFPRFTYDEPASAVNAAFGRLMHPYRLEPAFRAQYEDYLRAQSPTILPRMLRGEREERFGHEGELRWIPQDPTRTAERLNFLVTHELILEEAIQPALDVCTEVQDITSAALLMDYNRKHFAAASSSGPEIFEL